MLLNETAKNGVTVMVADVTHVGAEPKGMLTVKVKGYDDRTILFSTPEVAQGIAKLMLKDFNGENLSFVEEEDWTTVFND